MSDNVCIDCGTLIGKRAKRCRGCAMRYRWAQGNFDNRATPEYRARVSQAAIVAWALPECKANHAIASADPEYKRKISERMKKVCSDPKHKRKMSRIVKAYWANSENKAYRVAILCSNETRRKNSERTAAAWARGAFDDRDRSFYDEEFSRGRCGNGNPNWKEGASFEPYPPEFNSTFKDMIRKRDNYICAICKLAGKDVHHIDYNKNDTIPENCIVLCRSCHSITGGNRKYWQRELSRLITFRQNDTVDIKEM